MKIAVIGAGPAGMMAAISAASKIGNVVMLFERNEKLGKKLYITGKGRCNVTNTADLDGYIANIPRNPRFLYSAFAAFDHTGLMEMLETLGVPLAIERGGRVFPASGKSSDVIRALEREIRRLGVEVRFNARVSEVLARDGVVSGVVAEGGERLSFDRVIVCTGGFTYPATGSTGDGYAFAQSLGHNVIRTYPALTGLDVREMWARRLQGLTLKNVRLSASWNGKTRFSEQGELLFTHFGISGPLALTLSSYICDMDKNIGVSLDLKPALDEASLDKRLVRDFEANSNKAFKNALDALLPRMLIPVFLELISEVCAPETRVHDITRAQRTEIVRLLKHLPLTVVGVRPREEAVITRGGVSVRDVSPRTMESKLVKELYFAGEVLDVDALTGGFNLQIAFSTGWLAGAACAAL